MSTFKDELSSNKRIKFPYHHIDPGFINKRKCFSIIGQKGAQFFNRHRVKEDDHWAGLFNDHLIVDIVLKYCKENKVRTLGEILQDPEPGQVFCSTEKLKGASGLFEKKRVQNKVILPYESDYGVILEFGTSHFVADTGKTEQSLESVVSIVGQIRSIKDKEIIVYPILMGAPSLDHHWNKDIDIPDLMWYSFDFYEIFPEDIAEFSNCKKIEVANSQEWLKYMKSVPEADVKRKICEILGDIPKKDWPGEANDHFTTSIHLDNQRLTAAFLLKGPAKFQKMTPRMLGKQGDQIYRLTSSPAELFVVQHCHQIGEAVRATLRSFAVSPHNPRRYCLIDGKDTYRILKAYRKL